MGAFAYEAEHTISISDAQIDFMHLIYHPNKLFTDNHIHSYYEFHYITEGTTSYTMNFGEEIPVSAGEWLLIGPDAWHEESIVARSSGYVLGFSLDSAQERSLISVLLTTPYYKGGLNADFGEVLSIIYRESKEEREEYETCCKNLFEYLLIQICRDVSKSERTKTRKEIKQKNLYEAIDTYFNRVFKSTGQSLCMDDLASLLHMSPRHINRILLSHYGVTFHEKLVATKMKYAELLLKTTDRSIKEISASCGITEVCLTENFKKIYGTTPAKYRKANKTDTI